MKKLIFLTLLFFISQNTFAGWHFDKLLGFNVYTNGGISMVVETEHECGSQVIGVDSSNAEYVNRIISVLLSHQAQDKKLRFAIQSCSGSTAIIDRVRTY